MATEFANKQLSEFTKKSSHVRIAFEKFDIHFFNPSLQIDNVEINSNDELKKDFYNIAIEKVTLKVDFFQLILGKLNFNLLLADNCRVNVKVDYLNEEKSDSKKIPITELHHFLTQIPIERVRVDHLNVVLNSDKMKKELIIRDGEVRSSYLDRKLLLKVDFKENELKQNSDNKSLTFSFSINSLLNNENLLVRNFDFQSKEISLNIEGEIKKLEQILESPLGHLKIKTNFDGEKITGIFNDFNILKIKSHITGKVDLNSHFEFSGFKEINGNLDIKSEQLTFDKFEFGSANITAQIQKNKLRLSNIDFNHPSGQVKLKNTQVELEGGFQFDSEVFINGIDLQKLFLSLNMKNIPLDMGLDGEFNCHGKIISFENLCKGSVFAKAFEVRSEMSKKSSKIVAVDEFKANGEFSLDKSKVVFSANINMKDSQGTTDGVVDFEQGFDINFTTPNFNFKNIVTLAQLDFKGELALKGNTKGDSNRAVFSMSLAAKDLELEKYRLGDLTTLLSYEKGILYFKDVLGRVNTSGFSGALDLNLYDNKITGALDFSKASLLDLTTIFRQIIPIPFLVDGAGSVKINFGGPLDFWKMNYKLQGEFQKAQIHKDTFNKVILNINSNNGIPDFSGTKLFKNKSEFKIDGIINEKKQFELIGTGKNFKLEESEFIKDFSNQIFGFFDFTMKVKGPIDSPSMLTKIDIRDSLIGDKIVDDSIINIFLNKNYVDFDNQLMDQKLKIKFRLPLTPNQATFIFDSDFNDFDVTYLFPLIGAGSIQNEYQGSISGRTNLSSSDLSLKDLNGDIFVKSFYLQRGTSYINLQESSQLIAQDGTLNLRNLVLKGPDNLIEISGEKFNLDKLNLQINANSDLRLFHFILPFMEELSGPFELGAKITGAINKPKILGQAQIINSYVKIKNFVHPFEKINASVIFSQSKIFIQNLNSFFASGTLKGEGQIELNEYKNIPINIRIKGENLNLNVPENIKSTGRAELNLTGKWFPFLLSGTYFINGGAFEKEFNEDSSAVQNHQSIYLPKNLKEDSFEPLIFDILLITENKYLVKNSQVEGYATGNLQLKGAPTKPSILGKLEIEKGTKLLIKDKVFDLQTGLVNFTNSSEINPDLYITATSRVSDYDINLLLQGPAKTATIKMTSVPPLAENELISLLALGVTSQKLEQNVQSKDQAAQTGYEIGAAVLSQSALTKNIKNRLGLDIQFVNQFDSTKNISVLKATVTKKITNKIQATATRSLGADVNSEVKLQYFFNNNFSAIGNWEGKEVESVKTNERESQSVFGLDLEFKREFR